MEETNYSKAYVEVLEILKFIPKEDKDKIPQELLNLFENKKNTTYKYAIMPSKDFSNLNLLKETKAIITILYRDYWATPEEKEKIINKQNYEREKIEEKKRKKYNPNEIFKKNEKNKNIQELENNLPMQKKEQTFRIKLMNLIRKLFYKSN